MFISVDLPEPDEPMMATDSPRSMRSDTPCSTGTSTSPKRYCFVTPSSSRRGSPIAPSEDPPEAAAGRLRAGRRRCRSLRVGIETRDFGDERVAGLKLSLDDFGERSVADPD